MAWSRSSRRGDTGSPTTGFKPGSANWCGRSDSLDVMPIEWWLVPADLSHDSVRIPVAKEVTGNKWSTTASHQMGASSTNMLLEASFSLRCSAVRHR